tara:strand:+ start:149 stop:349 length:201 start_codon:yes stop_codon:yes gene_type:complete
MNHEVEAYVGELRELREKNKTLKEKLKEYEIEKAWLDHNHEDEILAVDWDLHSMIMYKDIKDAVKS